MNIRNEYPRPQQKRNDWFTLNGEWDFCFDDADEGLKNQFALGNGFDKKIVVPFPYQYKASGIGDESVHEIVWYKKQFSVNDLDKNYLLCFGGVDYVCDVYLNGMHVGSHEGAYTEFDVDVTKYLKKGENLLVLRVYDPEKCDIPRGKQSWKGERFGCWYVPVTGVWKSVWMECFNKDYVAERTLFTSIDEGKVYGEIETAYSFADKAEIIVYAGEKEQTSARFRVENGRVRYNVSVKNNLEIDKINLWSPENPYLYGIRYKIYKGDELLDEIVSRFGMRKISVENGIICLNNKPYYQKLILDQGYFGDGGLTALSVDQLKETIVLMKQAGFNGARKHQKIEDPYFYYFADELGFLTWLEMPSAYNFGKTEIQAFNTQIVDIIAQNCSFTSIVAYVPLNESWGVDAIVSDKHQQAFAKSLYYTIKALDDTRLVSTNDGWEGVTESDIITVHDYCRDSKKYEEYYTDDSLIDYMAPANRRIMSNGNYYKGQPLIFSEYGGIAFAKDSTGSNWGYGDGAKNAEEMLERIKDLSVGLNDTYFQGFCYTQLTDVQQEVNGLFDADYNAKLDLKKLKEIFDAVK